MDEWRTTVAALTVLLWVSGCDDSSVDSYCEHICDCRVELGCNDGNCAAGPGPECQSSGVCITGDCVEGCEPYAGTLTDECRECVVNAPCSDAIRFEEAPACQDVCVD